MRRGFYKIFISALMIIIALFLSNKGILYAEPTIEEKELMKEKKCGEKQRDMMELIHKKMSKRTKECKECIDSLFFTLDGLMTKAREEKQTQREKEFIVILSDYNSVLGDLGVIQTILNMAKLTGDKEFTEYFEFMTTGFEHLKSSFSLKNELFLNRIDELKDEDALRYEKRLLSLFREYFEYDLWREKIDEGKK